MTVSVEEMQKQVREEIAMPSRLGHTALFTAGLAAAGLAISLLLTEPALPARTIVAFSLLALVGCAWSGFAAWVLVRRRVLFGRQRIVAARMALGITLVFLSGAVWLRDTLGLAAIVTAALMVGAAITMHGLASRRVAKLAARRRSLESGRS